MQVGRASAPAELALRGTACCALIMWTSHPRRFFYLLLIAERCQLDQSHFSSMDSTPRPPWTGVKAPHCGHSTTGMASCGSAAPMGSGP